MVQKIQKRVSVKTLANLMVTVVLFLLLATAVVVFDRYAQEQLYQGSVNQLTEISAQLFEKLEVQLDIQWDYLAKTDDQQKTTNFMTADQLSQFLAFREEELSPVGEQLEFIAIDRYGYFYNDEGKQGMWPGISSVTSASQQSFLITDWITNENKMVFLRQLENPLNIDGSDITYFAVLQPMEEMAPYFRSSAFHNQNTTYVIDQNGVKMFMDSVIPDLDFGGRNIFHTMREQVYPHIGSFDACLSAAETDSFVCTDVIINGSSYYLALKKLEGYDWSMLFLVPSDEVAASTRAMTSSMIRIFIITLVALLLFCILSFLFVSRFRKNQELLAVKTRSEAALSAANKKLEDANGQLESANERLESINAELEQTNRRLAQAQEATADALAAAENASKAKTDFLSNMSHDIRTPMNAIIGITTLMENELNDPDILREHLAKLESSGRHLLNIINDILDMSRIESGKTTLNITSMNLADQVNQIDSILRPQANERNQTLDVVTTHLKHENVLGDPTRLNQVLVNILSNSVKYTPEGGHILFEIEELPRDGHYARYQFIIEDNGVGMNEEFVKRLYDPFTRAENSVTNKVQGTGLGMAITKSIVDLMGGIIHVDSTPGKGSRFEVTLEFPIDKDADAGVHQLSLLLLRCTPETYARIQDAVEGKPILLQSVPTLEDALAALRKSSFDVILMPCKTPGEDIQKLRDVAGTSAILLGAAPSQSEEAVEPGLDGLLPLPFFLSNLETEVERVQTARATSSGASEVSPLNGMKFLCAEDNELNAEILKMLLELKGASCTVYPNGKEISDAFESVKSGDYDMILMDVMMPVMDGLEAARRIRNSKNPLGKTIPIIAMTANAFVEDIQKSKEAGMDEHLSKPVDISALEQTVRRFHVTPPQK